MAVSSYYCQRTSVWHVAYHRLITKQFDYHIMENINDKNEKQCAIHSVSNRFSDPKFIDNVCLSYRHDFGLLSEDEQNKVRFECKEWMRAIKNNEPY